MPDRTPYERVALEYCAPRGIRLSEFLTVWSVEDQWAALEWQADQNRKCRNCGQDTDVTLRPGDFDKWNAEISGHCDGCRALHRAEQAAAGRDELDEHAGARFRLWRDSEEETGDGCVNQPSADGRQTRTARQGN